MPIYGGGGSSITLTAGTGIAITGTSNKTIALAAIADGNLLMNNTGSSAAPVAQTIEQFMEKGFGTTQGSIITNHS